jgi:hypothetical protein
MVGKLVGSSFRPFDTFLRRSDFLCFMTKSEPVMVQRRLQPRRSVDQKESAVESLEYRSVLAPATEDRLVFPTTLCAYNAELARERLRHESIGTSHEADQEQNVIGRRERLERALDE